jgi:hypothetical protein
MTGERGMQNIPEEITRLRDISVDGRIMLRCILGRRV